ncbi:MAG: conserved rane protein of unknown function [Frankiales bacterium]|nr:conserved rane protein of unknown function [Frankiales bacterium]
MTEQTQGKGRPTPKRSQRARGPVSAPPTNRREAAKALRAKQAEQRTAIRTGSKAGDDRYFLARDKGPERAYVRDIVDSQRTLGPILLPYMIFVIGIGFTNDPALYAISFLSMLAMLLVVGGNFVILGRGISKKLNARFPDVKARKHVLYGIQRTMLIRRWRTPPARVAIGADV